MAKIKILVVDDHEDMLHFLSLRLTSVGFAVILANTGQEAINKAQAEKPDLILMDIMLPDIDGSEAVKIIKENPDLYKTPVLFISAIVGNAVGEINVDHTLYKVLSKPFDSESLIAEIRSILQTNTAS